MSTISQTNIIQYSDGTVKVDRDGEWFILDPIRVVGGFAEVIDVLRWEFLGAGVSLEDAELQRIARRVMQVME